MIDLYPDGLTSGRMRLYERQIMPSRLITVFFVMLLFAPPAVPAGGGSSSGPRTIIVALDGSGDFSSIQDAVDAAARGDTVFLKPGR